MPITTEGSGSIPFHGQVYFVQLVYDKFFSDLRQHDDFLWALRFAPTMQLIDTNITEHIIEGGVKDS
jgi:hypothetical protein